MSRVFSFIRRKPLTSILFLGLIVSLIYHYLSDGAKNDNTLSLMKDYGYTKAQAMEAVNFNCGILNTISIVLFLLLLGAYLWESKRLSQKP